MDMQKSRAAVKVEPISEVYREETASGILVFHAKVRPSKPQVRRSQAEIDRDKAASPEERAKATERGRSRRLLGSLRIIYATRDPALFCPRHRVALLAIAGNLIAIANNHVSGKLALADLQAWADSYITDATHAEVAEAFEAAMEDDGFRAIPRPSDVGFDLELDKVHWLRAGRPWGIHPANITTTEVRNIQRAAKKARDKERAAAKRAASGATPQSMSVSAVARELGISRPTLYKRMRKAGFGNPAEFYSFVAPNNKKNYRSDESVNPSARLTASAAPVGDDADLILLRSPDTISKISKSSRRRAAPRPTRRKSEPVKLKEAAMPSNVIDFAPILADPDRREKLARLFDVVANSFSAPEPQAANLAG